MSNFFREMMPDNFAELTLLGGISLLSYKIIDHYRSQGFCLRESEKRFKQFIAEKEQLFKERELELIRKFKEREELLKKNAISSEALSFIKNL